MVRRCSANRHPDRTERFHGTLLVPLGLAAVGLAFGAFSLAAWMGVNFAFDGALLRFAGPVVAGVAALGLLGWRYRDRLTVGPEGIGGYLLGETIPWERIDAVTVRLVQPKPEDESSQSHWVLRIEGPGLDRELSLGTLRGRGVTGRYGEAAVEAIERFRSVRREDADP
jgi:hypothetical protein